MSKDVFWFKHDCNAHRDIKIRKIIHLYGFWGYGIFWAVIEVLREQDNYSWDKDDSSLQMLADVIGCKDDKKFISWYRDCIKFGLFEETLKQFCSNSLKDRMEVWETKKENGKKGGRPPKKNRTETEPITELKPDENHKRREEKSIEEKRGNAQILEANQQTKETIRAWLNSNNADRERLIGRHKINLIDLKEEAERLFSHYDKQPKRIGTGPVMSVLDDWLNKGKDFKRNGSTKEESTKSLPQSRDL